MRPHPHGTDLIRDAIGVLLRRLDSSVITDETQRLKEQAGSFLMQARDWERLRPTPEEREALLQDVLRLYMAAARLEPALPRPSGQ